MDEDGIVDIINILLEPCKDRHHFGLSDSVHRLIITWELSYEEA